MEGRAQTRRQRILHADAAMVTALALAAFLAIVLAAIMWSQTASNRTEMVVVQQVRFVRAELFAATLAQRDAEIFAVEARRSRSVIPRARLIAAHAEAHLHIAAARRVIANDAEISAALEEFCELIDRRAAAMREESAGRAPSRNLADSSEILVFARRVQALLNGRIDESRVREDAADDRITLIAGLLLGLTVSTALVGMFALRRARRQWRAATTAAARARAAARAADTAKSRFLAVASHDMRQPLHALTLYLSALERRVDGEEARDIIGKMDRAVQSMTGMFAALVDLARMQAGVITPDLTDAPLAASITRAAGNYPGIEIAGPVPEITIRTDPALFEQILSNLFANAIAHGGGAARVTAAAVGQTVEIDIVDDGPGIAEEDHERIFQEFERINKGREGLGLGLAIVRHLTCLLGISLDLQSKLGDGARFTLRVPTAAGAPTQSPGAAPNGDAAKGAEVMVLDDDMLARGAMASALRDLGAHVHAFGDEASFVAALDGGAHPRLLVMDLRIHGDLSGLRIAEETVARLKPAPRVIVVTGDTEADTLSELEQSGYAVLIKPVSAEALRQAALAELSS